MINLEKANCSAPPGRNPAAFKCRDDARSQIKYSALCKIKQEEPGNVPARSVPCSPLPTHPWVHKGPLRPRDTRLEPGGRGKPGAGQSHAECQMPAMCWAVPRRCSRSPLTQTLPPRTRPRLSRSSNEMVPLAKGRAKGWLCPPPVVGLVTQPPRWQGGRAARARPACPPAPRHPRGWGARGCGPSLGSDGS